jgi:hypothetical protein
VVGQTENYAVIGDATDAHATFSFGETFPNSASLFINDLANGKV